jgi:basic amino acid/polyamine antiporter, APA family
LSPVYWLFLSLSAFSVIVLRWRCAEVIRPFRVPLYPWLPLLFFATSLYVLYSSLVYVKAGAVAGVAVLAAGALLLLPLETYARYSEPDQV